MKNNELIEILKEFEIFVDDDYGGSYQSVISYTKDKKISRAFSCNGALKIIDEFDKMQQEKQELTNYLKEKIEKLHNDTSGLYSGVVYGKIESYKEILMIIEKSDNNE